MTADVLARGIADAVADDLVPSLSRLDRFREARSVEFAAKFSWLAASVESEAAFLASVV